MAIVHREIRKKVMTTDIKSGSILQIVSTDEDYYLETVVQTIKDDIIYTADGKFRISDEKNLAGKPAWQEVIEEDSWSSKYGYSNRYATPLVK